LYILENNSNSRKKEKKACLYDGCLVAGGN
jgi:hypothetical protein